MEDVDIEQVVIIPDTPDRSTARHIIGAHVGKEINSSVAEHSRASGFLDKECLNRSRAMSRMVIENGYARRLHSNPQRIPVKMDGFEPHNKSMPTQTQNASLFRRGAMGNNSKPETRHSVEMQHMGKGKAECSRIPSKSPVSIDDDVLFDMAFPRSASKTLQVQETKDIQVSSLDSFELLPLRGNNSKPETRHSVGMQHKDKGKAECSRIPSKSPVRIDDDALCDMDFPRSASKTLQAEETKDIQVSSVGGSSSHFASMRSRNAFKGKEKVGLTACSVSGSSIHQEKGIDITGCSQPKTEKQLSASFLSITSPRVSGHKRLVRNGCISPHNIATRAQRLAESLRDGSTDVGKCHSSNLGSDGAFHVDISEIVADENNCHRAKGKGVSIHPSTSKYLDIKIVEASPSSGTNNIAANETSYMSRDPVLGGWRSTCNRPKKIYHADGILCFSDEHLENEALSRNAGNGNVTKNTCNSVDQNKIQTASSFVNGVSQITQQHHIGTTHTKRQKKHELTSRNHNEFSTMVPDDSELLCLGSLEESSSSRASRTLNKQHQGILDQIYEVDELSPEQRNGSCQGLGSTNIDSDAKARQLEADEMLARELQEQLYHEVPVFGDSEIDQNLAWVLQQEEDAFLTASSQNHPISRIRSSSTVHANRHPQPQSFQNPSNRRGAQGRVPATRASQLRNRFFNQSPAPLTRARTHSRTALSREMNFQFPLGMDLDMRLDILEALEDAVGEFSDMSMTASRILQVQRDFNGNDYEMLLALDENNHQHGASANRINSLPESVVQTGNFEETCAICLETPTVGETIRHLPCLHKFHKDCIDPWLSRKASCPVCKSSIT